MAVDRRRLLESLSTDYAYDDADRLVQVTDPANQVSGYSYDTENNLIAITDALNRTTDFAYDALGRVTQTIFPSGFVETYGYDNAGNLTTKTDRNGHSISYSYDGANRLTQKSYPGNTVAYVYDSDNRLTTVTDSTGTYRFTYDAMGRLTSTTTNYAFLASRGFNDSYGYDLASNRTSFQDPESGQTTYAYDSLNRRTSLQNPQNQIFTFGYDALSRRTSLARPNGVTSTYGYDPLSRLLSVLHRIGSTTLDGATYTVDAVGNRTSKRYQPSGPTTNYGYDSIYQLLNATQGSSTTESYSYDPVGNRLSSLQASYTYSSSNEIASASNASYAYDNNGNVLSKTDATGTTSYTWDAENRLTQVALPGTGGSVSFKYDPFGRRIYKSSLNGTSVFAYDGANIVEEVDASGTMIAMYTQGPGIDEPMAMLRGASTSYYQQDGLGTVTSLSDQSGSLAQTYTFDAFGRTVASSGSLTNPFRYTGREFDTETGLYYYRARYYDPAIGRFISEDPINFGSGLNFYRYVRNNPTLIIDPFGLAPFSFDEIARFVADNNNSGQSNELIICMIYKESTFNPQAVQKAPNTARGLMGVTKRAAADIGTKYSDLSDPARNIYTGTRYLYRRINWKAYGNGDVQAGLAGYGEGDDYADSLLQCEKCMKKNTDKPSDCKTEECLLPLHGGK